MGTYLVCGFPQLGKQRQNSKGPVQTICYYMMSDLVIPSSLSSSLFWHLSCSSLLYGVGHSCQVFLISLVTS